MVQTLMFWLLLLCQASRGHHVNFQSGIRTLIAQQNPLPIGKPLSSGSPFIMLYEKSFEMPPLTLVAPLTFSKDSALRLSDNFSEWMNVQLKITAVDKNQLEILISSNLQMLFLKVSYLFVEKEVAGTLGLYIFNYREQQSSL